MSKEMRFSGEFVARAGLAAALFMGATACTDMKGRTVTHAIPTPNATPSSGATPIPTPNCGSLELFTMTRNTKIGSANAINHGECVDIYSLENPADTGVIGQIATGDTFHVDCYDLKGPVLRVKSNKIQGVIGMADRAVDQFNEDPDAHKVPTCT